MLDRNCDLIIRGLEALKENNYRRRTATWLFQEFQFPDKTGFPGPTDLDKMREFQSKLKSEEQEIEKLISKIKNGEVVC